MSGHRDEHMLIVGTVLTGTAQFIRSTDHEGEPGLVIVLPSDAGNAGVFSAEALARLRRFLGPEEPTDKGDPWWDSMNGRSARDFIRNGGQAKRCNMVTMKPGAPRCESIAYDGDDLCGLHKAQVSDG